MKMKQRLLIIVGPTASGKSALAVRLARKFNGEIISADSRQVYKGLDIGTGKITKREMKGVPHHLLDVAPPKDPFSASDFKRQASGAIARIVDAGKLPIVVGGTGFYIDSLVGRIVLPDVVPNKILRARLSKKTAAQLFSMLKKRDPKRAAMLSTQSERNNKVRLIRALEVVRHQGPTLVLPRSDLGNSYNVLWIGVVPSDAQLRKNITARLHARIRKGMVAEAKHLYTGGLTYRRMHELGLEYRSLARLLQKKITRAEMEKELQSDIWRYARKQIGYWKRNKEIKWFEPKNTPKIEKAVRSWLKS
ncbi:tRNA (adenosine(37)-N6)-dimethylallyltransferase MiaA [Candidatus Kaiserbacteria bacterium RIFCSPHIGHO2_02_FULL_55_25]|uniref:tRNA dimethylallyltransferase n=1 Tax=Candidatus Kaiserbacteria bacterium RIFCSPHIGHO2_02_FULL_55_25 TaxID=1798498 RepID=A0A1F6E6U7_9BACT|nr:MAG: tRNA (adenosine(37)-N6)-dimethylallyltransferase MiaA [Candidatus Kaiserbacteria bacterium RIFCSPHIGHO2_02_FULL_55_25]